MPRAERAKASARGSVDDRGPARDRQTPHPESRDYTDGAAEGELSLDRARRAFEDVEFHPDVLRPAPHVDTSCEILGGPSALPLFIAPTGFTRLMQTEAESAGASAVGAARIPFTLSTLGTTSIEDVKAANPAGRNWFQLYVMRQREISFGLVERAAKAGFDTLQFTGGHTHRWSAPARQAQRVLHSPAADRQQHRQRHPRPWWWIDFLTTPKLEFASLSTTGGTVGELLNAAMDPTISYDDLDFHPQYVAGQARRERRAERRRCHPADRPRGGRHHPVQPRRTSAGPRPVPFHLLPQWSAKLGRTRRS